MKNRKICLILFILIVCLGTVAGAQSDYWIEDYSIKINVGRNAVCNISEDLTLNYDYPHHGFYRYIPYSYKLSDGSVKNIKISGLECSDPYEKGYDNGYIALKIGSSDKSYQGLRNYRIKYNYDIGEDTNEGYDEFYFNLIGNSCECPIANFSFCVNVPCSTEDTGDYIFLTRGSWGSTQQVPFTITQTDDGIDISGELKDFYPGEALTLRVQLPDNWYKDARKPFDARQEWVVLGPVVMVICILINLFIWALFGRDSVPVVIARFEAPEGFSPLVEGFIADNTVDDKDITSMLYYWADRGYITITEQKKNKFVFTKIGDIALTAPDFERRLFYSFFASGDVVTMDTLQRSNFYEAMLKCKQEVSRYFTKNRKLKDTKSTAMSAVAFFVSLIPVVAGSLRYYLYEGHMQAILFFFVISLLFCSFTALSFKGLLRKWYIRKNNIFAAFISLWPVYLIVILMPDISVTLLIGVISALVCVFLASIIEKRSEYGTKVLEGTLGYREFIEKVQISELVTMIDKDPMLYYHILSYAIVFGLEDKWAKKFESVAVPPPVWFTGPTVFDYLYFTRMTSRISAAVRTNVIKNSHGPKIGPGSLSGGSFFGSSGFAGGGFGGGGGHAW